MLKLKLQYLGHAMQRTNSLRKTLKLRKTEGRRRGRQRMRWLEGITASMDMNMGKLQEMGRGREAWCAAVHGLTKSQTEGPNDNQGQRVGYPCSRPLTGLGSCIYRDPQSPPSVRTHKARSEYGAVPDLSWEGKGQDYVDCSL